TTAQIYSATEPESVWAWASGLELAWELELAPELVWESGLEQASVWALASALASVWGSALASESVLAPAWVWELVSIPPQFFDRSHPAMLDRGNVRFVLRQKFLPLFCRAARE